MGYVITSPVPEFPGTVTLIERPTMDVVEAFMDAKFMYTAPSLVDSPVIENGAFVYLDDGKTIKTRPLSIQDDIKNITPEQIRERRELRFMAAIAFVEKWSIEGQPEKITSKEDLNPIPYAGAANLIKWLLAEVFDYCMSGRKVPKVSLPESTDTPKTPAATEDPAT